MYEMAVLDVKNLKKIYRPRFGGNQVQALSCVNFSVEEGEYVAIMGESGSGKTTLLNILAALDRPTSGEVLLEGKSITHLTEKEISAFRRKNLGFVFQDFLKAGVFVVVMQDGVEVPVVKVGVQVPAQVFLRHPLVDLGLLRRCGPMVRSPLDPLGVDPV